MSTVGNGRPHKRVCSTDYQEALIFNLSLKTNSKALHYQTTEPLWVYMLPSLLNKNCLLSFKKKNIARYESMSGQSMSERRHFHTEGRVFHVFVYRWMDRGTL